MAAVSIECRDRGEEPSGSLPMRQTLAVGITLFSMFFGAGNLILPPLLGVQAGTESLPALLGFFAAGVGLPVLGIVAVALAGTLRELAARVHRQMELYHRLPLTEGQSLCQVAAEKDKED